MSADAAADTGGGNEDASPGADAGAPQPPTVPAPSVDIPSPLPPPALPLPPLPVAED